jgi:integrase
MGRTRVEPSDLPKRVYQKHGAVYYVDFENKWHRLGGEWDSRAEKAHAALAAGKPIGGSVAELLDRYLTAKREKFSPRHNADRQQDGAMLKRFFGKMQATAVQRKHVATYLQIREDNDGNAAPIRANREISLLSAAYNYATELEHNPCLNVPRNAENVRERYVEHWERTKFGKTCCPKWLRAFLLLKYLTGLRQGDMLKLDTTCETAKGLAVEIGKSQRRKVMEFQWTWALRSVVQHIHMLKSSADTRYFPLSASGFKSAWRRAMAQWKAAGNAPFWEHDIRAKTASDSRTLAEASERLGHDRTSTTKRHYRRGVQRVAPLR